MLSIQELISGIFSIKAQSDELASLIVVSNTSLQGISSMIAGVVRGSSTGQDAVMALNDATKSLADAAASMKTLSRTCDDCMSSLSQ